VTLVVFALIRVVIRSLVGRDEIDPAVYLLDRALLSPEAVPYAMYLVAAIAAPVLGFATFVLLRRGPPAWLLGAPLVAFAGVAVAAVCAEVVGQALGPLVPLREPGEAAASSLAAAVLRTWLVTLPFLALGALVATANGHPRHAAAALAALAVIEPLVSSSIPRGLARCLLNDNVQSIMRQNGRVSAFEDGRAGRVAEFVADLPGSGAAALVVAAYTAGLVVLTLLLKRRTTARGQIDRA